MASLPPGCMFYPSEELLLGYYLTNKNSNVVGGFNGADLIKPLNLYDREPFELPWAFCFSYGRRGRKRHWYCYTVRVADEERKARSGFWLKKGVVRNVLGGAGNVVLGTRTRYVFYVGNLPENARRTNWILYEYALANNPLAPFVLCRVFDRSPAIGASSCITCDVVEAKAWGDSSVEMKIEVSLIGAGEQDDRGPVTAPQERLSGLPYDGALFIEAVTSEQLSLSIQEEDFIELNDLA